MSRWQKTLSQLSAGGGLTLQLYLYIAVGAFILLVHEITELVVRFSD